MILFLVVTLARICYVSLYSVDTPFWDQWDGEANVLLKPWHDGTWSFWQLFSPHNEHRIAFSRALVITLFELNGGQWSNLAEAYVNTGLAAAYLALLARVLMTSQSRLATAVTFVTIAAAGVLPFSWENFLVGFQSQFYFMALFAVAMLALAAFRPTGFRPVLLLGLLGAVGLFTTASGLVAALAVIFVIGVRAYQRGAIVPTDRVVTGLMLLVVAAGLHLTPSIPYHETLKPQGLVDTVHAVLTALTWPVQPALGHQLSLPLQALAAGLMWSPSALWLLRFLRTRQASSRELFAIGLAAWAFVQCVAIAHSRGHDMPIMSSRYTDIPALGTISNAWLMAWMLRDRIPRRALRNAFVALSVLFAAVVVGATVKRTPTDVKLMLERADFSVIQTRNVQGYLRSRNPEWLDQPFLEIPYPSAELLQTYLEDPTIAGMLPASLRGLPTPPSQAYLSRAAYAIQRHIKAFAYGLQPSLERNPRTTVQANEARWLEARNMSDKPVEAGGYCTLDLVDGKVASTSLMEIAGANVQLRGWAVPALDRNEVGNAILLEISDTTGRRELRPTHASDRPDVAAGLKQPAFSAAGFDATLATQGYTSPVTVRVLQAYGGKLLACPNGVLHLSRHP